MNVLINKRINSGDVQIKTIGRLLDFATDEQINEYFEKSKDEMLNVDTSNFII